jgi:hypothetical protein
VYNQYFDRFSIEEHIAAYISVKYVIILTSIFYISLIP